MDPARFARQRLQNRLHSALLVAAMSALLAYLGWLLGGALLAGLALGAVVLTYALAPRISPRMVLGMFRGRLLDRGDAPQLYAVLGELSRRAGLPALPRLCYVPSDVMNAFAVGTRQSAVIALSDGILRRLDVPELAAVLAHEVSHIAHNDLRVMGFADIAERFTRILSLFGQILVLVNLPLMMIGAVTISWVAILLLIGAPTLSALAQLALARTREYNADLGAALLLGDPRPMAGALAKMERFQGRFLEQLFGPGQRLPDPSLLRTHPPTAERVRRLLELRETEGFLRRAGPALGPLTQPQDRALTAPRPLRPRWHITGSWY